MRTTQALDAAAQLARAAANNALELREANSWIVIRDTTLDRVIIEAKAEEPSEDLVRSTQSLLQQFSSVGPEDQLSGYADIVTNWANQFSAVRVVH